jgi:cellobiose phosphorylase
VIPGNWTGFTATRIFRGTTYHITVTRAGGGNLVRLVVNGNPIEGDIVPLPPTGTTDVAVKVTLS